MLQLFHKVLVLQVTCIIQEHVFLHFLNFSVNSSAIPYCPPCKFVSKTQMSAARHNLDWSAMSAHLLFEGDDAILHNTVQTPSRRGHRSLPATAARFPCGRSLTPARITDITLSQMTLGKCHLLVHDVTLTPARIADITPWWKCLVLAAMLCPRFYTRSLCRRSERYKWVKHFQTIHTLRPSPDQGGNVCKVWLVKPKYYSTLLQAAFSNGNKMSRGPYKVN
jgi:hypothetical protein